MRYSFGFLCVCTLGVMGCSEPPAECQNADDCNDANECTEDVCDSASRTCSNPPVEDGTACSLNGISGVCVSGACGENLCQGVVCEDDGNECTSNVCNVADGTCNLPAGTPCATGACLDGTCTALTSVNGTVTVQDVNDVSPAAGATVSVVGTSLRTTTNERGEFAFDVFTGDWFFQSEKDDLGGVIQLETLPTDIEGLELSVFTDAVGAEIERELGVEIDDTKGVISVNFGIAPGMALGGETAELSEPYEHTSATNADGDEVLTNALLPEGGPDLTFWNVNVTEELVVTPKWVDGMGDCVMEKPGVVYPIRASFVTFGADARCTRIGGSNGP